MSARIPDWARVARRRLRQGLRHATEQVVLRGVFQRTLGGPWPADTDARTKPHFVVTRYKEHAKGMSLGDSTEAHFLDNSLAGTGYATFDTFFWEREYTGFPSGDRAFMNTCRRVRPDAILLSSYEPNHATMPRPETLRILRQEWGIPVVGLWYDTCWDGFWEYLRPIIDVVDVHVVVDNPTRTFMPADTPGASDRFLWLALPWDPAIYHDPRVDRDLDVSFLGQVAGYRSTRRPFIEHLMEHNVPIYWSAFEKAQQRPLDKYVEILTRSKIALNFSHSVTHHQLKGRVYEVLLCGAMLMETDNPQTASCFEPMWDYVAFTTPADLLDKIRHYLAHDTERREIAARGQVKARAYCDGVAFWTTVTSALERRLGRPLVRTPRAARTTQKGQS